MVKLKITLLCLALMSVYATEVKAVIIPQREIPVKNSANYSLYSRDLNRIESELYGRIYQSDSDENRIKRIENTLYEKNFDNYSLSRRMNMILRDYAADMYRAQNGSMYCSPSNDGILSKLRNTFIGQPMGYTPPVTEPSPYLNTYGPSYMRGYYGTNGWNSHNSYNPIQTGAGVHILD